MQRAKYASEFKDETLKQIIDKGHSVVDVPKRFGIAEGFLYTWVSKFKKANEPESSYLKAMQPRWPNSRQISGAQQRGATS